MFLRLYVFAGFLLLCPVFVSAQIEDADIIFRELRALKGTWFMPQDRGDRLEVWEIQDDSTLTGRGMRIKAENGDTVLLETMTLELRGDTITYNATVRGQNKNLPVPFELTLADVDGYLFENPGHDNPQKIRYRLLGNRELQVLTEVKRGNRTVTDEYIFEREFTPAGVEFRLRGGLNVFNLRSTGYLTLPPAPTFGPKMGWELGAQVALRGNGGFITVNIEAGLTGKYAHAKSEFYIPLDTFPFSIDYKRDVTYKQTWLIVAVAPEITFRRDGRLSLMAGPYYGRLLFNRTKGTDLPGGDNPKYDANEDFKKNDIGIIAGLQCKLNIGKKDLGSILGLRVNLGLANLDNLYTVRQSGSSSLYNGRISLQGISFYYCIDLLKL